MDPYDSDSTGLEDEGDYTDTGVLLGYASKEAVDDNISHLGGWPTWLDGNTPPPGHLANCKVCNRPMSLLLELNGDLPEHFPDDERRLYIFGCPRRACNRKPGSIRALRATRKFRQTESGSDSVPAGSKDAVQEQTTATGPKQDLGASIFGKNPLTSNNLSANANPFSSSAPFNPFAQQSTAAAEQPPTKTTTPAPTSPATLSETFADKIRLSSPEPQSAKAPPKAAGPPKPWPPHSAFPSPYPHYYLDAEYETLSRPSTPEIPTNATVESVEDDSNKAGSSSDPKDTFESDLDKAFIRFSTRLSHNPEQVLRYEFRGSPLLYSHGDQVGKLFHGADNSGNSKINTTASNGRIPRCESCGSARVFEFQLVPHAITVLEESGEGISLDGMEWGTIILGVCGRDCGAEEVGTIAWREEWTGVQWEETR